MAVGTAVEYTGSTGENMSSGVPADVFAQL
jgi:hypothetical protein